ncbi:MAG: elongation factor 4 [Candidatus Vogelbacteria bacterium CG10_big_fil_rev_8_21_14_0_10_49_38]|uniref:Elongation factor 4 n=1 Tax=Candidatus Vogelbacteria bacterium CG10_big_fil_rev_8_21_14_0_10_49_38 TaxID=1975043 RepID=A0A2H0RJJ2_9BACT|nr:MAG: elongation factor 4 [bacterium CG10_49_38]PIR46174.1 MAG: elongation factor 4 [Candidatus Vogelbacteria bacterium CG10_big_fil_rev_8_21_14_0_10_49_38]
MESRQIRNFSIIAHIDHGKSTLADRLLEVTGAVPRRQMKEQFLDTMELERERGITIKMQPVRLTYHQQGEDYELNLIDTPGHIDFSYEVSRSLKAVEGVVLLVDATQGVQAQTLTVLSLAREQGLAVIPALNKIDLPVARVEETRAEIVKLLGCQPEEVILVSGKTGAGAEALLAEIVRRVPPPKESRAETKQAPSTGSGQARALVFDFEYSNHKGIIVYTRVLDGELKKGDHLIFIAAGEKFTVQEVGIFSPAKKTVGSLSSGQIGYVVTGIKERGQAKVGDTLTKVSAPLPAVPGYALSRPVVWASLYPADQDADGGGRDDFTLLRQALERLNLQDAALSFEEEYSGALGRGFRAGFLGMLHLEIITERLKREFGLRLVIATPTISYRITGKKTGQTEVIYSPHLFPTETKDKQIWEPWISAQIIAPHHYLGQIIPLLYDHEAVIGATDNFGDDRTVISLEMPLRELMRHFFDQIKSVTAGFASLSYELIDERPAEVTRLDVLLNGELEAAFSRVVPVGRAAREAEEIADKLAELLPRQLITIKIQVTGLGRIIAARSISALKKDVTGYLYGGDITRKRKLWEKQKKGKKKMQARGTVNVPHEVFLKMMKVD